MINLMDNRVLGPLILKQFKEGRNEGRSEGLQEGRQGLLEELLIEKFGDLPAWAEKRLHGASADELHTWAKRILYSTTLEDTLR